ncbi:DUF262 domain-containing protein [Aeromonas salmonicida]|uniref:DUF262 domain-containing protein n=1 Tax=Aeromonas salmonicida TaxID=645 RepID=UPI0035A2E753
MSKNTTVLLKEYVSREQKELEIEEEILSQSKRIDYYTIEYSVEFLVNKLRSGDLYIPLYQRKYTWPEKNKSRFIESILLGFPVPFFFLWENPGSGNLEIVDGVQRLSTLREFIDGALKLEQLDSLESLNECTFSDLASSRQKKLLNRPIRGIVLSEGTDESSRIDLFERINTGSKIANPSEVRRGSLQGQFMDLIQELGNLPEFVKLSAMTVAKAKEYEREELVSRFFAYSDGLESYKDNPRDFIFRYVKNKNNDVVIRPEMLDEYRARFMRMVNFVETYSPNGFAKSQKVTPRVRFEAISLGCYLALKERPNLVIPEGLLVELFKSDKFNAEIRSDGANSKVRLYGRINVVKNALLQGAL